jgi:hypothetical protein
VDILSLIRERAGDYDCPVCKRSLAGCSLTMLREDDPLYTVQVSCARCKVSFVVVLQVRHTPATTAALSAPQTVPAPPISADEVLDVHELLRDHTGPLTELFSADRRSTHGDRPR